MVRMAQQQVGLAPRLHLSEVPTGLRPSKRQRFLCTPPLILIKLLILKSGVVEDEAERLAYVRNG